MPDWPTTSLHEAEQLREELRAEQETNLLLQETIADLELAAEDIGWHRIATGIQHEFTTEGRRRIATLCRAMAVSNPLIKRGLQLRIGYIWGQGVEVTARIKADENLQQEVNDLLDDFDHANEASLTGTQACEELERAEGTDGEVFLALFTSPLTGVVKVRSTPADEVVDIITNPDDRDDPWFYVREYTTAVLDSAPGIADSTYTQTRTVRTVHPALGYRPSSRLRTLNGVQIRWDAPILHVPVNRLDGWQRGVPDAYASISYGRMYRDFLVDWAGLTKAQSKIAWKMTGDTKSRAAKAAAAAQAQADAARFAPAVPGQAGGSAAMGPGINLEAVSKSGATIDSESGRPLAAMVAAGLGVSVVDLLADPGTTGARAVAETLDKPIILEMGMRRLLWQSARTRIYQHVITAAIEAPRGRLSGRVEIDDWGQKRTYLEGNVEPVIEFTWPPLADLDPVKLVEAVVSADGTGYLPPVTVARLLLQLLGVPHVDDVLEELVDENGEWLPPKGAPGAEPPADDPATMADADADVEPEPAEA